MWEAGFLETIDEPYHSFRENAFHKAKVVYDWLGSSVLSDDSGICVPALNGAPGVHSARFAGEHGDDQANNEKLLERLKMHDDRSAYYTAVLCLIIGGKPHFFEGRVDGIIALEPRGDGGFGYDPLFIPNGYGLTFGQLDEAIKKEISHRAQALKALAASGLLQALVKR